MTIIKGVKQQAESCALALSCLAGGRPLLLAKVVTCLVSTSGLAFAFWLFPGSSHVLPDSWPVMQASKPGQRMILTCACRQVACTSTKDGGRFLEIFFPKTRPTSCERKKYAKLTFHSQVRFR